MFRGLLLSALLAVSLGACSFLQSLGSASTTPTGTATPAIAQDAAYSLESAYGVALNGMTLYGALPDCSATHPAPCRTYSTMLTIEGYRSRARASLDALRATASSTSSTASQLDTAITIAKGAMAAFQAAVPASK